jgi:tetratricopeptide (TPR) repeat protein
MPVLTEPPFFATALLSFFATALLFFTFTGCSSAPKKPAEVFTLRNAATTQLELANREADRGNYPDALDLIGLARDLAYQTDDPPLIIRTGLALGNILFSLGREGEAAAAWDEAEAETARIGSGELSAICGIYRERAKFLASPAANAAAVRDRVTSLIPRIKEDRLAQALGWIVAGLAEKELRRFNESEAAFKKSLAIHDSLSNLEQAAWDWYLIASSRSVAGFYNEALEALDQALSYDRRAENSYGLGKDWFARGEVLTKAGRPAEAEAAYRRSKAIFAAAEMGEGE